MKKGINTFGKIDPSFCANFNYFVCIQVKHYNFTKVELFRFRHSTINE